MIINVRYIGLHRMYMLFLSDINGTWILSTDFWKNMQISIFIKISPVGAGLFHTDRWTDSQTDRLDELIFAFNNFSNAPKSVV
jgi:hypothetical protein